MAAEPPESRKVPALMLTLPVKALAPVMTRTPVPALVSEPVPPEIRLLMVNALAEVVPSVVMMTSVLEAPRVPVPVMVAAPVLLSKSTPPEALVRSPLSVRVWAPASLSEFTLSAPATVRSAVER